MRRKKPTYQKFAKFGRKLKKSVSFLKCPIRICGWLQKFKDNNRSSLGKGQMFFPNSYENPQPYTEMF